MPYSLCATIKMSAVILMGFQREMVARKIKLCNE